MQLNASFRRVAAVTAAFAVVGGLAVVVNDGLSSAGRGSDNVLDHSGFRMGAEGWEIRSESPLDVSRSSPGAVGSRYALRIVSAETADVTLLDPRQGLPDAQQGQLYRAVVYLRSPKATVHGALRLGELRDGQGIASRKADFTLTGTEWQRVAFRYRAESSSSRLQMAVTFAKVPAGASVYVDHLYLTPVNGPVVRPGDPGEGSTPGRTDSDTKFGASVHQGGQSWSAAVAAADQRYGNLDVVRVFYPGLPDNWPGRAGAVNRPVVVSFKAPPAQVLSGQYDAELLSWFRDAPRDRDIWWAYFHEPEDDVERGAMTAQQWRQAYRRIAGLAERANNPALHNTIILMCWTSRPGSGRSLDDFFPGRDVVETIGWDCYNKADYYSDPVAMFSSAIAASRSLGVGFGIAELGSKLRAGQGGGADRAQWLRQIGRHLSDQGAEFVTYFDSIVGGEFRLLDSASQQAWRDVVNS